MGRQGLLEIVFKMSGSMCHNTMCHNVVDVWMYLRKAEVFCLGALKLLCGSVHELRALKTGLDTGPTRADIRTLARNRLQTFTLDYPDPSCSENDVEQSVYFF